MIDPIFIGPYKSGISQYYKPYAIGNDAFVDLENAYSYRGSIKKREGSTIIARLPIWNTATAITNASPPVVTTTSAHGLATGDMVWLETVVTNNGTITAISVGDTTTITTSGAHGIPLNAAVSFTGIVGSVGTLLNGKTYFAAATTSLTITLNLITTNLVYTSGGSVLVGALEKRSFQITVTDSTHFSLQNLAGVNYPASGDAQSANIYLPVVGLRNFIISATSDQLLVMFHPKQAFLLNTSTLPIPAAPINVSFNSLGAALTWSGTRDNFFYTSNYFNSMWATNNVDNIRFFNGSSTAGWDNLQPIVSGTTTMTAALLVLPYKGRLVTLNTTEGGTTFYNRARWSQIGTPFAGAAPILSISSISAANPAVVTTTSNHNLTTGQSVSFLYITGTDAAKLNAVNFIITKTGATTFTIPLDTTALTFTTTNSIVQQLSAATAPAGNDINAWRSDLPGKGGFVDADTSEPIVSVEIIQDTLIVGFQFSTWRLRFTGNQIQPFIWERINTQFGSEGTFTSISFDDRMLMISRRGIVGATFNSVERIDMIIPDVVDDFQVTASADPFNRIHGIRDIEKRLVYWIYGDNDGTNETPNKMLCYNYEDNTWAIFIQSFTCLGIFKQSQNNIWSTWITDWIGDSSTWNDPQDETNIIIPVAGAQDSNVWRIMQEDVGNDNGVNYGFSILTGFINPYIKEGKRSKLVFYDIYSTDSNAGQITIEYYQNDNQDNIVYTSKVNTAMSSSTSYYRVFLGGVARSHQILLTMTPEQIADPLIGQAPFEMQGILMHMSQQGRIKI